MSNVAQCRLVTTEAVIDLAAIVDQFPGPACVVDAARRPLIANALWRLMGLAAPGDGRHLPGEIAASLLALCHTGRPQRVLTSVGNETGAGPAIPIDATCLPCSLGGEAAAIVLATDCTPTEALRSALAHSRDFHRDLALCSTDTTFEIDAAGRFTYVGQRGFLGHAEFELIGGSIRDFVSTRSGNAAEMFVTSREPVDDTELWFATREGTEVCFMVSAIPVFNGEGEWSGLRGVGREVTEERAREREIDAVRRERRRIDAIIHAMRSEARPSMMIGAGATAVLDTIELAGCAVVHASNQHFDRVEAFARVDDQFVDAGRDRSEDPAILAMCRRCAEGPDDALLAERIGERDAIVALTRYGGRVNGAVAFLRDSGPGGRPAGTRWSEDDRHLLRSVAGQMSIAMAQLDLFEGPFAGQPG